MILYELCALKPPFVADSLHFLAMKIVRGSFSPIPSAFSSDMKHLVGQLLSVDPSKRPTINEILNMPYLKNKITNFLSDTQRKIEFSHTILHQQVTAYCILQCAADLTICFPAERRVQSGACASLFFKHNRLVKCLSPQKFVNPNVKASEFKMVTNEAPIPEHLLQKEKQKQLAQQQAQSQQGPAPQP